MNATDSNTYFAKAVLPVGNPWRTKWTDCQTAQKLAEKYASDWQHVGVAARASVFYRNGALVSTHSNRLSIQRNLQTT